MSRIAIVYSPLLPELQDDDALLVEPLARAGIDWDLVLWDDPAADWPSYDVVLIRGTWDYYMRIDEWRSWLEARAADGSNVQNPIDVVLWNMDKRYLRDLGARDVPVVETAWLWSPGDDLAAALAREGWARAVVKPAISAGAYRTWVTTPAEARAHQADVDELLRRTPVMVQPFLEQITAEGEWSLVFVAGEFSHALVKRPAGGDFRVQFRHGGTFEGVEPSERMRAQARAVLERAGEAVGRTPEEFLYARVDGVRDGEDLLLIELELFEPVLYFSTGPGSADRFVAQLARLAG